MNIRIIDLVSEAEMELTELIVKLQRVDSFKLMHDESIDLIRMTLLAKSIENHLRAIKRLTLEDN